MLDIIRITMNRMTDSKKSFVPFCHLDIIWSKELSVIRINFKLPVLFFIHYAVIFSPLQATNNKSND